MVASQYHRRFTLLDAIILIAATGTSIASARTELPDLWAELRSINVERLADLAYVRSVMFAKPHTRHSRSILSLAGGYVRLAIYGGNP